MSKLLNQIASKLAQSGIGDQLTQDRASFSDIIFRTNFLELIVKNLYYKKLQNVDSYHKPRKTLNEKWPAEVVVAVEAVYNLNCSKLQANNQMKKNAKHHLHHHRAHHLLRQQVDTYLTRTFTTTKTKAKVIKNL